MLKGPHERESSVPVRTAGGEMGRFTAETAQLPLHHRMPDGLWKLPEKLQKSKCNVLLGETKMGEWASSFSGTAVVCAKICSNTVIIVAVDHQDAWLCMTTYFCQWHNIVETEASAAESRVGACDSGLVRSSIFSRSLVFRTRNDLSGWWKLQGAWKVSGRRKNLRVSGLFANFNI